MTKDVMKRLLRVAKGIEPPDSVIRNGKIVNVFTNEIEEGLAISMKDGWIVSIGKWSNTGPRISPKIGALEPTAITPSASNNAV